MIMKKHQQNRLQCTINKNMADQNCSKSSGIKLLYLNLDLLTTDNSKWSLKPTNALP